MIFLGFYKPWKVTIFCVSLLWTMLFFFQEQNLEWYDPITLEIKNDLSAAWEVNNQFKLLLHKNISSFYFLLFLITYYKFFKLKYHYITSFSVPSISPMSLSYSLSHWWPSLYYYCYIYMHRYRYIQHHMHSQRNVYHMNQKLCPVRGNWKNRVFFF